MRKEWEEVSETRECTSSWWELFARSDLLETEKGDSQVQTTWDIFVPLWDVTRLFTLSPDFFSLSPWPFVLSFPAVCLGYIHIYYSTCASRRSWRLHLSTWQPKTLCTCTSQMLLFTPCQVKCSTQKENITLAYVNALNDFLQQNSKNRIDFFSIEIIISWTKKNEWIHPGHTISRDTSISDEKFSFQYVICRIMEYMSMRELEIVRNAVLTWARYLWWLLKRRDGLGYGRKLTACRELDYCGEMRNNRRHTRRKKWYLR